MCQVPKDAMALTAGERNMSMPNNRTSPAERAKPEVPKSSAESSGQTLNERAKSLQDNGQVSRPLITENYLLRLGQQALPLA